MATHQFPLGNCWTFILPWPKPERTTSRKEGLVVIHSFRSQVAPFFQGLGEMYITVEECGRAKLFTSRWLGRERRRRDLRTRPSDSTSYFHPIPTIPLPYESVRDSIHQWRRSNQEPITAQKPVSWQPYHQHLILRGRFTFKTLTGHLTSLTS